MSKFKKWLTGIAAGIAALFGAHKIQPVQIEHGVPPAVVRPVAAASPSPHSLGVPIIKVGTIQANDDEIEMVKLGFKYAQTVNESECAHQFVLQSNFTENYIYDDSGAHGPSLTPGQIWNKLVSNAVTVNVVMFTGSRYQNYVSKTVGYEDEPGTVYINRYFVGSAYAVADNIEHEGGGHSQGFSHLITDWKGWPTTTNEPYGMNNMFEVCASGLGIKE